MHALPPIRAHDLVWIADAHDLILNEPAPAWATPGWLVQTPVVVRREFTGDEDRIPIGVRGMTRAERVAGYAHAKRIVRRLTPEAVVDGATRALRRLDADLPCLRAFADIAPRLEPLALSWGVTGSAGFALATGLPVLRESSDLDLLIRVHRRLTEPEAVALSDALSIATARVDAQIDTGLGGFALLEWLADRGRVMLKTAHGPVLVADPWAADEVEAALAASLTSRITTPFKTAASQSATNVPPACGSSTGDSSTGSVSRRSSSSEGSATRTPLASPAPDKSEH